MRRRSHPDRTAATAAGQLIDDLESPLITTDNREQGPVARPRCYVKGYRSDTRMEVTWACGGSAHEINMTDQPLKPSPTSPRPASGQAAAACSR